MPVQRPKLESFHLGKFYDKIMFWNRAMVETSFERFQYVLISTHWKIVCKSVNILVFDSILMKNVWKCKQ